MDQVGKVVWGMTDWPISLYYSPLNKMLLYFFPACPQLPVVQNGFVENPSPEPYYPPATVTYRCNQCYERVGPATVTCNVINNSPFFFPSQSSLNWSAPPTCNGKHFSTLFIDVEKQLIGLVQAIAATAFI